MRTSLVLVLLSGAAASLYGESNLNHSCVITNDNAILSCSAGADPSKIDTCCAETYGGLLLATQFWDTYTGLESQGQLLPEDTWTLHGLWPDFCNGSYTQYCDLNRQYDPRPSPNTTTGLPNGTVIPPYHGPSIDTFIEPFGRLDLVQYMNTFWINQGAPNTDFWAHEFSKHATCYSTFDLPCYGPMAPNHTDVLDFFQTAILYYRRLPTWGWLASAGIRPSNTTTYTLSDIQGTLARAYGATPYIGCTGPRYNSTPAGAGSSDRGYTVVDEVWYYMHAFGRPQAGVALPVNATTPQTSCATSVGALHYYERTSSSLRTGVASEF